MLRVGLTGGIACGKSRVRRHLAAAGFGTLDLDGVAHEMIAPGGPAYDDVVAAFGPGILAADGTVDRKVLGARVFADAAARAELNALVHPRVRDEEARRAAAHAAAGGRVFVTDAALLVEAAAPAVRPARGRDCEGGELRLVARDRIEEAAAGPHRGPDAGGGEAALRTSSRRLRPRRRRTWRRGASWTGLALGTSAASHPDGGGAGRPSSGAGGSDRGSDPALRDRRARRAHGR